MGATRLASGHFSAAPSRFGLIFCSPVTPSTCFTNSNVSPSRIVYFGRVYKLPVRGGVFAILYGKVGAVVQTPQAGCAFALLPKWAFVAVHGYRLGRAFARTQATARAAVVHHTKVARLACLGVEAVFKLGQQVRQLCPVAGANFMVLYLQSHLVNLCLGLLCAFKAFVVVRHIEHRRPHIYHAHPEESVEPHALQPERLAQLVAHLAHRGAVGSHTIGILRCAVELQGCYKISHDGGQSPKVDGENKAHAARLVHAEFVLPLKQAGVHRHQYAAVGHLQALGHVAAVARGRKVKYQVVASHCHLRSKSASSAIFFFSKNS